MIFLAGTGKPVEKTQEIFSFDISYTSYQYTNEVKYRYVSVFRNNLEYKVMMTSYLTNPICCTLQFKHFIVFGSCSLYYSGHQNSSSLWVKSLWPCAIQNGTLQSIKKPVSTQVFPVACVYLFFIIWGLQVRYCVALFCINPL